MKGEASSVHYPFPPITEAVVEFRFESEIDFETRQKIGRKLNRDYPNENIEVGKKIEFNIETSSVNIDEFDKIVKRRNNNEDEIVVIGEKRLNVCKLPVYDGWDNFLNRVKSVWSEAKEVTGYRKLSRIGLRYINRIDFPAGAERTDPTPYVNVHFSYPSEFGPMINSKWSTEHAVKGLGAVLILKLERLESPLPKHMALLLDIDLAKMVDVPQKDDDIFAYLEQARVFKNTVFELAITDETRKRFSDDVSLGS